MLDRNLDTDAMWQAAAHNPLYQRVDGGPTWALYRYARENLDQALSIALSSKIGVAPAQVVAGRYFFVEISSCCPSGAAIHVTARGALHGAVIDVTVGAPTAKTGNATVPVAVPDSTPPDRYDVSVSVSGSSPVDAGVIAIGRSYEAEYFAGVYQERDLDKNAWHQWVSIHDPAYSRGLASYTNTLNVTATRPIDLPGGSYCMSVTVYDPGDGSERDLAVEVAGGTVSYSWGGGPAGMREIAKLVTLPGGPSQLAYRAVAPAQLPVILDRISFYPTSTAAGAAAC
jgi:hypothetical protein